MSDETAAKPSVMSTAINVREHEEAEVSRLRDLLAAAAREIAELRAERDAEPRNTVAQRAWHEARSRVKALETTLAEQAARIEKLEAALAKVPHLMKGNSGPDSRFIIKEPNALHDRERCAAYGGRCAALAGLAEGREG